MVIPVVGILLAAAAGAATSAVLAALFRLTRVGLLGAPLIGFLIGGVSSILLQALGGGALQFLPETGMIDWPPVVATMGAGGACAAIASFCVALMRLGGRAHPFLKRKPKQPRRFRSRRVTSRQKSRSVTTKARSRRFAERLATIAGTRD